MQIEPVEDEYFVSFRHDMTRQHNISFAAYVTTDRFQLVKFYPEGNAGARFQRCGSGLLYLCCNRHVLSQ